MPSICPHRLHIAEKLAGPVSRPAADIAALIEVPPDPKMGEYAFPCFALAKQRKAPPPKIAAEIAAGLAADDVVESVGAAGGYVNFRIHARALAMNTLPAILRDQTSYCSGQSGETVVIDFSSPNIAKPLSIGHLRSTVLGNALSRILRHLGARVVGINHLGDWGTQFGYLLTGWRRWGSEEALAADPISHLFELYVKANSSDDPTVQSDARAVFRSMEEGDPEALATWKRFRELSLKVFGELYDSLGVVFDSSDGEAFFNDKMEPALQLLDQRGLTTVSDGALVVPMGEGKKPALLRKSDGATLYLTRDLAAALHRLATYKPDRLIYVVGAPQREHFVELFHILKLLDPDNGARFVHVDFGAYRFKDVKMSTRSGNVIFLNDVIHKGVEIARAKIEEKNPGLENKDTVARQVALAAIVFGDLVNDRVKDIIFEWEKVLDFDGDTAPYVMFAHVRALGIIRKLAEEGVRPSIDAFDPAALSHDHERRTLVLLSRLGEVLAQVAKTNKPHLLATYLLELARVYHRFCHDCPVSKAESPVKESRLALTQGVATVLSLGLHLLGIPAPERM